MGGKKISAMTELPAADVVAADMVEIVDASASENKKLSISDYVDSKVLGTSGVFASLDAAQEETITTGGTYQPLLGTYTNDPIVGFEVVATPGIKYTGADTVYFEIDWHAACSGDSNGMTVGYAIKKNGTLVAPSVMTTYLKTANEIGTLSGTCVLQMETDDEVQIVLTADGNGDKVNTVNYTTTIRQFLTN